MNPSLRFNSAIGGMMTEGTAGKDGGKHTSSTRLDL
jgi:hypothetical protein